MSDSKEKPAATLSSGLTELSGIGDKTAASFSKIGIDTVGDLLRHFPRSYDRYEDPIPIADLAIGETATIAGTVKGPVSIGRNRKLAVTTTTVADLSGSVKVTWFRIPYIKKTIHSGQAVILRGTCVQNRWGVSLTQPEIFTSRGKFEEKRHTMQPVYARPQGLSNQTFIRAVRQALPLLADLPDPLPEDIRQRTDLLPLKEALAIAHFPTDDEAYRRAHDRLCFDEFLAFILRLRRYSAGEKTAHEAPVIVPGQRYQALLDALPYQLTEGQEQALQEITNDLGRSQAMSRLVQGDVGCGKTVLAVLALLAAVDSGYQGVLMAPTLVLAVQHHETISRMLGEAGIDCEVALLTGDTSAAQRRVISEKMAEGRPMIFVGTQALIQKSVRFGALGLVVTDEQHRFGARQRTRLSEQGGEGLAPHILVMSATPIPRTLGIILYGDLSISQIRELPAGRLPVKNAVMHSEERDKVFRFIDGQIRKGRQVYAICPLVEASDSLEAEAVTTYTGEIRSAMGGDIRAEALHGRMKASEKERILTDFAAGRIDILVSTSVVEVGINIPNATVMLIENADRFGLAQLHQLRGRIGRGEHQSYCIFLTSRHDERIRARLDVISHSNDGFEIASEDLKTRGPGDLFGLRQSGFLSFETGDIFQDSRILTLAAGAADEILAESPELSKEKYRLLRGQLERTGDGGFDDAGEDLVMRVIAGSARHLTLQTPKGDKVRPTTDRIKETLFNMIQVRIADARFLDLFAGSGGIGIEALSRGAAFCAFSDHDRQALACIRANLSHTGLEKRAIVLAGDYSRNLARLRGGEAFDIIFMDPPYGSGLERSAMEIIASYDLLDRDGIIIVETDTDNGLADVLPQGWRISREKIYKTNKHVFIEKGEQP